MVILWIILQSKIETEVKLGRFFMEHGWLNHVLRMSPLPGDSHVVCLTYQVDGRVVAYLACDG